MISHITKHEVNMAFLKFVGIIVGSLVLLFSALHFFLVDTAWMIGAVQLWLELPHWIRVSSILFLFVSLMWGVLAYWVYHAPVVEDPEQRTYFRNKIDELDGKK
jgi:hypothetical protein